MNTIDITVTGIPEPNWIEGAESFCQRVLDALRLDNWELSIVFCNNLFIQELNNRFRNKNEPTDVLSFSQLEGEDFPDPEGSPKTAGDLVVSVEMVEVNRTQNDTSWEEELKRLLIHGILHLAGYDHEQDEEQEQMLSLQDTLLKLLKEERIRP
ncbi:MAG: rRNA maturation RNase YbeY [Spirochaetales bacterium]